MSSNFNQQERKIITLSSIGSMLEIYDFVICGTFAIYFSEQFFVSSNPVLVAVQTFLLFTLGFVLRPIGGVFFSRIGDMYGRKRILVITIMLMGLASLIIACTPTYATIGIAAPILLVLARLMQGLALGGELGATYVYIHETMSDSKRSRAFGVVFAFMLSGYLFVALISYAIHSVLSEAQIYAFGWRIPFALGAIICLVSYKVRSSLHETQAFEKLTKHTNKPITELFKSYKKMLVMGVLFSAAQGIFTIMTLVFLPSYIHLNLHLDSNYINKIFLFGLVITIFSTYLTSKFATTHNVITILKLFAVFSLILIPISFYLIVFQVNLVLGMILLMLLNGIICLCTPFIMTSLFPTRVCLTGVGLSYNIGVAIFGGTSPLIASALMAKIHSIFWVPVFMLSIASVLCLLGLVLYTKNRQTISTY